MSSLSTSYITALDSLFSDSHKASFLCGCRNLKKGRKGIRNADAVNEMRTVREKSTSCKTGGELSFVAPAKRNVVFVDKKRSDQIDRRLIGVRSMKYRY